MDPNQNTVRSIAELLVEAEDEDTCESMFTNQYCKEAEPAKSEPSPKSEPPSKSAKSDEVLALAGVWD